MKKIFKRLISLCLMMLTICFFCSTTAFAEGIVNITVSSKTVAVGGDLTVLVEFSSSDMDIQSVQATLEYDDSIIEIASDSVVTGAGGVASLKGYSNNGPTIAFTIKFKAIATGTSAIKVTNSSAIDMNNESLGSPTGKASVTVSTGDNTNKSDDSTLKSIELSKGTLSPAFSPEITEYTVELDEDVKSIYITGQNNSPKATIWFSGGFGDVSKVDGTSPLAYKGQVFIEPGENKRFIKVTSESGEQTTYTINVKAGEGEKPVTTPEPNGSQSDPDTTTTDIQSGGNIIKNSITSAPLNSSKGPNDDTFLNKVLPLLILLIFFVALVAFMVITWAKTKKNKKRSRSGNTQRSVGSQSSRTNTGKSSQSGGRGGQKVVKTTVRKSKKPTSSSKSNYKRPR